MLQSCKSFPFRFHFQGHPVVLTLKNWDTFSLRKANTLSFSRLSGSQENSHSLMPWSTACDLRGKSSGFGSPTNRLVKLCWSLHKDSFPLIKKTELFWLDIKHHLLDFLNSWTCTKTQRDSLGGVCLVFYQEESVSNEAWQATDEQSECMLFVTNDNFSNY